MLLLKVANFLVPPSVAEDSRNSSAAATYSEVTTGINPTYAALGLLTTGNNLSELPLVSTQHTQHWGYLLQVTIHQSYHWYQPNIRITQHWGYLPQLTIYQSYHWNQPYLRSTGATYHR